MRLRGLALPVLPVLVVLSVACGAAPPARADAGPELTIGQVHTIRSEVLGETRTVFVHLPPSYPTGTRRYPVLYMTDADGQFGHTATTADFLAITGRIPQLIVVGITNTERTRDLTPTAAGFKDDDGQPVPLDGPGGADRFLRFITTELFPYVDKNFRTVPYRVFAGHSFGGLFGMHALFTKPDAFQGILAVSPTLNWDDDLPLKAARPFFAAGKEARHALFVAVGDEPRLAPGFKALQEIARASKAEGFEATFREYPEDDHGSLVLAAHHDGLRALFAGWQIQPDHRTGFPRVTAAEVTSHFETLSKRVGFTIVPAEQLVNLAGYGWLRQRKPELALPLFELNARNYPDSANVWDSLADGLAAAGRADDARVAVQKAVAVGEKNADPLLPAFRKHAEALSAPVERLSGPAERR